MRSIQLLAVAAVMTFGLRGVAMQAGGRAGGGNPAAAVFNDVCAGCHGTAVSAGPRAPSLLDDQWAHGSDDESVVKNIRDGFPAAGMPPFKESLSEGLKL